VGENIETVQKNTQALLDASKEVCLEVNPEKSKYTSMLGHAVKSRKKYSIKIANRSFEDVAKFKYLGTKLTDKNCIHRLRSD
jgi:hypothetical protein